MDILQEKWYGGLPCFKLATEIAQPRPLGVAAVTGVFILLGVGMALGFLILLIEHLFFRYTLPILRNKPKGSVWRSRNIMFFSQVRFFLLFIIKNPRKRGRATKKNRAFRQIMRFIRLKMNWFLYKQTFPILR